MREFRANLQQPLCRWPAVCRGIERARDHILGCRDYRFNDGTYVDATAAITRIAASNPDAVVNYLPPKDQDPLRATRLPHPRQAPSIGDSACAAASTLSPKSSPPRSHHAPRRTGLPPITPSVLVLCGLPVLEFDGPGEIYVECFGGPQYGEVFIGWTAAGD